VRERIALLPDISRQRTVMWPNIEEIIVDHVSVLAIAAYLLSQPLLICVLVCLSTIVLMFVAYF